MLAARALAIRELLSQEVERLSIVAEPIEDGERPPRDVARGAPARPDRARGRRAERRRRRMPALLRRQHPPLPLTRPVRGCPYPVRGGAPDDIVARDAARESAMALVARLTGNPPVSRLQPPRTRPAHRRSRAAILARSARARPFPSSRRRCAAWFQGWFIPSRREPLWPARRAARPSRRWRGACRSISCGIALPTISTRRSAAAPQQQYVSILAGRAQVTGVDLAATRGPLVQ